MEQQTHNESAELVTHSSSKKISSLLLYVTELCLSYSVPILKFHFNRFRSCRSKKELLKCFKVGVRQFSITKCISVYTQSQQPFTSEHDYHPQITNIVLQTVILFCIISELDPKNLKLQKQKGTVPVSIHKEKALVLKVLFTFTFTGFHNL